MGRGGAGMGIYHTCPTPFNFLNGTGIGIVSNKRGGVGMGAIRPEPARCHPDDLAEFHHLRIHG